MPWASRMDRFRKTFSFRKKKKKRETPDTSKPQQWLEDEKKVREGNCSFQVKYLGYIEVFESRGLHVCEEAIKALRKSTKRTQRAILYVSGDALRVADEISKGLIVDQTIEKVSFCAPDRNHEKGFAYICRDGATRRWMCHAFLAVKESGERLSHAVGCAFAICLEKKQKREKEAVQVTFNDNGTSFARMGSFRQATLTERLQDPQSAILAEPPPASSCAEGASPSSPANAIPRPHASASIIERQGSLRMFPKLQETSPFKRDLSLRLTDLPSNIARLNHTLANGDSITEEMSPVSEEAENQQNDTVGSMASDFAHQLNLLTNNTTSPPMTASPNRQPAPPLDPFSAAPVNPATLNRQQHKSPAGSARNTPFSAASQAPASNSPFHQPASQYHQHHQSPQHHHTTTTQATVYQPHSLGPQAVVRPVMTSSPFSNTPGYGSPSSNPWTQSHGGWHHQPGYMPLTSTGAWVPPQAPVMGAASLQMMNNSSGWSPAISSSGVPHHHNTTSGFGAGSYSVSGTTATVGATSSGFDSADPFDLAWTESGGGAASGATFGASGGGAVSTNPFLTSPTSTKAFEVKM